MNGRTVKRVIIGIIFSAMLFASTIPVSANTQVDMQEWEHGISVLLDGIQVNFNHIHPVRPFTVNGTTFLSIEAIETLFGLPNGYDEEHHVVVLGEPGAFQQAPMGITWVTSAEWEWNVIIDENVFRVAFDGEIIDFSGSAAPFVVNNTAFLPLRPVVELLDLPVGYDAENHAVMLGMPGRRVSWFYHPPSGTPPFIDVFNSGEIPNDTTDLVTEGDLDQSDIEAISTLTNLRRLFLWRYGHAELDITPLQSLTELRILGLDMLTTDLTALQPLTNLEHLILEGFNISDLTPLMSLTNLQVLEIRRSTLTQDQIDELQHALPNCNIIIN